VERLLRTGYTEGGELVTRLIGHATVSAAALATAVAALTWLAPAASAKPTCHPGVHKVGSAEARTFCGPAEATVNLPGGKVKLQGGSCTRTSGYLTVNIGTTVLSTTASHPPNYFGITVGKPAGSQPAGHDGTYVDDAAIAFVIKHKRYAVIQPTVVLKGGRTLGSFSGTLLTGGPVSGSFHC
jgi:hypothetical protein